MGGEQRDWWDWWAHVGPSLHPQCLGALALASTPCWLHLQLYCLLISLFLIMFAGQPPSV